MDFKDTILEFAWRSELWVLLIQYSIFQESQIYLGQFVKMRVSGNLVTIETTLPFFALLPDKA